LCEECGKAMPGGRHSDRNGEGADCEDQRGGPQGGSVDPVRGEKIVGNYEQKENGESDESTFGPRYIYLLPWETSEGGLGKADGGENDQALVSGGLSTRLP